MGLLIEGTPLDWRASEPHRARVRADGVVQFLSIWHATKGLRSLGLKWGDEVEYQLVKTEATRARYTLRAPELLEILQKDEEAATPAGSSVPVLWRPEYPTWMIEGTPGLPYRCFAADLVLVEKNMSLRRALLQSHLSEDEHALTISNMPTIGVPGFTAPFAEPGGPISRSLYIPDAILSHHPRFRTLTQNIRARRAKQIDIRVPLFVDKHTNRTMPIVPEDTAHRTQLQRSSLADTSVPESDRDYTNLEEAHAQTTTDEIHMDTSAFGMGSACLQVTLQANDVSEGRYLYDQLAIMAPLMLALTASTVGYQGLLADSDARWKRIEDAMDDRSPEERRTGSITKPRYSSIDCFISDRAHASVSQYNDIPIATDPETYKRLREGGVDHLLAQHIAHLFMRDPLVIYADKMEQDNALSSDHFENIQSTNWNTVRFKPPPPGTDIGWRTEFRSMEVSLTDFENAAFCVFTVLLSRVILAFDLNLYIPMSCVDANMDTAHLRNAAQGQTFFFRKNIFSSSSGLSFVCDCGHIHHSSIVGSESHVADVNKFCRESSDSEESDTDQYGKLTLAEILNGKALCQDGRPAGFAFAGLIPLMRGYLASVNLDESTHSRIETYLDFISERAAGRLCTTSTYLRNFIRRHSDYKQDSVISEGICRDLMVQCSKITSGEIGSAELLGRFHGERVKLGVSQESLLEEMNSEPVGALASTLKGRSLPKTVLFDTVSKLAATIPQANCGGC